MGAKRANKPGNAALRAANLVQTGPKSSIGGPYRKVPFQKRGLFSVTLSHFLTVFRASPVRLHISPSDSWSRNFMRRTLPIMSMVITFYIPAEIFSRAVELPCQFSASEKGMRTSCGNLHEELVFCSAGAFHGPDRTSPESIF